jgi:hypothetical protein
MCGGSGSSTSSQVERAGLTRPVMGNLHGVALGTWAAAELAVQVLLHHMANLSPSLLVRTALVCGWGV